MVGRLVSLIVTATLCHACIVPASAGQQDQKREREVAKVRKQIVERGVGPQATVEVQLRNGTRLLGIIYKADDEEFTLIEVPTHRPFQITYSEVRKVRSNLKADLNRKVFLTAFSVLAGLIILGKLAR